MSVIEESPEVLRPRRVVVTQPRGLDRRERRRRRQKPVEEAPLGGSVDVEARLASPTTSIRKALLTMGVAFVVAFLLSSRGLVHSAQGMDEGAPRTILLAIADADQAVADVFHLSWPWDQMETALGRTQQTSSPLLSSAVPQPTTRPRTAPTKTVRVTTPPVPALPRITRATPAHPLRLLITGDSLTEFMGPDLVDKASQAGSVLGWTDTHYGTGLVRPDFVDWSLVAKQQVGQYHPSAVIVLIGGNDNQNMTRADGSIIDTGTAAWTKEYQRRAEVCMRTWTQGGKTRVFWLSMPPARTADWTATNMQIDLALQRAARSVPGSKYLNILGPVTDHGRYSDFVTYNGVPTLMRASDGIHFTPAASDIIAGEVLRTLERDWKFGPFRPKAKRPR